MMSRALLKYLVIAMSAPALPVHAEVGELRIARQYGIGFIQLMIMEDQRLVEKYARGAGLGDVRVAWSQLTAAAPMNDALLAGQLDLMATGIPSLVLLWSKTAGTIGVKGLCGLNSIPQVLLTRDPNVKTIRDFTEKTRIAVPAVRVSGQAMLLQMAAAKEYGWENYNRLDNLTVSVPHPEAAAAMLSGEGEITAHFTVPPFNYFELKKPGVRVVTTSRDILGGPHNLAVVVLTSGFYNKNPRLVQAVFAALQEATAFINRDKRGAAEIYVRTARDRSDVETIYSMLADPANEFTLTPRATMRYADFLHRTGSLKVLPSSWKELYFSEAQSLPGD
jgi:NitT/TauT family transport system substrate-binding protein